MKAKVIQVIETSHLRSVIDGLGALSHTDCSHIISQKHLI